MHKTEGQTILEGMRATREFLCNVALMIQATDSSMKKHRWSCYPFRKYKDQVIETSFELQNADEWLPYSVYRFFISDKLPNILVFVAVLLDDDKVWEGFEEPWACCGIFSFLQRFDEKDFDEDWIYGPIELHIDPNGSFYPTDISKFTDEERDLLKYESFMAVPLVSIVTEQDVEDKLVNPLLEEVNKVMKV